MPLENKKRGSLKLSYGLELIQARTAAQQVHLSKCFFGDLSSGLPAVDDLQQLVMIRLHVEPFPVRLFQGLVLAILK